MAVPTLTGVTSLNTCESLTGWSGWGIDSNKWILDTDFELEGNNCIGLAPKNTGDGGYGFLHGSSVDLSSGNILLMWIFIAGADWINTSGNHGVYIRITDSISSWTTNYLDFDVGGSDVAWCGRGWHLVALDCTRTADRSAGTAPVLTTIRMIGLGKNAVQTAISAKIIFVDNVMTGSQVEVKGVTSSSLTHNFNDNGASADTITRSSGDFTADGFESGDIVRVDGTTYNDGEYIVVAAAALALTLATGDLAQTETGVTSYVDAGVTLESIYQKDGPTDDNWWGIVSKNRDGDYEINYTLLIGDESGADRTFFISRGDKIVFADQPLSETTAQLQIKSTEDTGNTIVAFGESTGTGDNRVGFSGSIISQDTTFYAQSTDGAALAKIDLSDTIDTCELFGTTLLRVNDGAVLANDTSHYSTNTIFSECGQVDTYNVECRNLSFSGYAGTDGALLWRNGGITETQLKNSNFLANARAVEHTVADAGEQYTNLTFSGNTYDIHFSAAAGDLVINATGTSNPSQSKVENDSTGSVTVNNTKVLTITCKNAAGIALEGIRVRIENLSTGALIANGTTNALGVYQDSTYNYGGDVNVKVIARLKGFKNNSAQDTITSNGLSIPFTMLRDESVNLP